MSRPLKLTAADVGTLGAFLDGLNRLTEETGWRIGAYGRVDIARVCDAGEQVLAVSGGDDGPYFVDDSNGD
jgi:hypothetical protein